MSDNIEAQMERLNAARERVEEIKKKKARLSGELDGLKKQKTEKEKESEEKFKVSVGELPALLEKLNKQAEESLQEAEKVLGLKE